MLSWGIVYSITLVAAISTGLMWGYIGVARCYSLAVFISAYPAFSIPLRLVGLKVVDLIRSVWRQFLAAIGMALVLFFLESVLSDILAPMVRLPLLIAVGIAVYLLLGLVFMRSMLMELFTAFFPVRARRAT
jgi:hypothetical protein